MPDDNANVVTKQEAVEVLDSQGNSMPRSGLSSIFDKIEAGKAEGKTTAEILDSRPDSTPDAKPEGESTEPKTEPTNIDVALQKKEQESKPEPKAEDKPEPEHKDDGVADDELAVLPHDKPKTAKRIRALLEKISKADAMVVETKKEAKEKADKLQELQDQLSKVKTVDPETEKKVQEQLDELAQYRRRYDLEKDPEVQSKFDARIAEADNRIYGILKARGAGDALLNLIKEEGGWVKFSSSGRVIPLKGGANKTASELAQDIMSELPYAEQRSVDAAAIEQAQTKSARDHFFSEETKKAKDYFAAREKSQQESAAMSAKSHKEALAEVERFNQDILKSDFLQEKKVPDNATAEQKAAIEDDNRWAQQIRAEHAKYHSAKTLPEILAVVKDAVLYHNERHKVAKLTAEVASLKASLDKFKRAGQSTTRGGSIAPAAGEQADKQPKRAMSLTERLDRMEAGQNPDE